MFLFSVGRKGTLRLAPGSDAAVIYLGPKELTELRVGQLRLGLEQGIQETRKLSDDLCIIKLRYMIFRENKRKSNLNFCITNLEIKH